MQTELVIVGANDVDGPWFKARREHTPTNDWYELGGGINANAYGSDKYPYVVKIVSGFDSSYDAWVDISNMFPNRYTPKVFKRIEYYREGNDRAPETTVYYMERLKPVRRNRGQRIGAILQDYLWHYREKDFQHIERLRPVHRDLLAALEMAREKSECAYYDLHAGNVMKRGSQLVVTDPLN